MNLRAGPDPKAPGCEEVYSALRFGAQCFPFCFSSKRSSPEPKKVNSSAVPIVELRQLRLRGLVQGRCLTSHTWAQSSYWVAGQVAGKGSDAKKRDWRDPRVDSLDLGRASY